MTSNPFRRILPALFLAGLVPRLGAVDISGTLTQSGGGTVPSFVAVVVTTAPVKDPLHALDPAVFIASASVSLVSVGPYSFTGLPFFGGSTDYYLYSFRDANLDNVPNHTEPMGGYGPFPYSALSAKVTASTASAVFPSVSFSLFERGEISGTLTNSSNQPGRRLVLQATPVPFDPDKMQRVALSTGPGGAYSLGGLLPGVDYLAEAFVDTQWDGENGSYNPDPFEDKAYQGPFAITAGVSQPANLLIQPGAVSGSPDHIRIVGPGNSWRQVISSGSASAPLQISIRDFNDSLTQSAASVSVVFSAYGSTGPFTPLDDTGSPLAGLLVGGAIPVASVSILAPLHRHGHAPGPRR
ncbi:MAG: hypothetical protein IPP35_06855 [Elusimicrobia bacterium]|nr:hypothetical protein [Elusimicrobiota bacterium]